MNTSCDRVAAMRADTVRMSVRTHRGCLYGRDSKAMLNLATTDVLYG